MPAVPSLNWAWAHETGSRYLRDRTPARDRWLNSSWTPSPGGTLNRPRGTSLEGLSGWIRIIGGPPARNAGPAPTAAAHTYHGGRRLGWVPLGRSTDPASLPQVAPAVPVNLPAGQASGDPGHGWSLPEPRESDHPVDPASCLRAQHGKHYTAPNR